MTTVLIVEDQQDVQRMLGVALQTPGRRLLHAFDGQQGLALARSERPELILLDIMMPGVMDGLTLLRTLRAEPAGVGVKVVIMSARTHQKDIAAAMAAGADDYLCKPFRLSDLRQVLDRHLASIASPGG
jgi:DNA-binding response OmpR family regulator